MRVAYRAAVQIVSVVVLVAGAAAARAEPRSDPMQSLMASPGPLSAQMAAQGWTAPPPAIRQAPVGPVETKDRQRSASPQNWAAIDAHSRGDAKAKSVAGAPRSQQQPSDPFSLGFRTEKSVQHPVPFAPADCVGDECSDYAPFPRNKPATLTSRLPYFGLSLSRPLQ